MKLRIIALCQNFWDSQEHSIKRAALGQWNGLDTWASHMKYLFGAFKLYQSCGTWSDPAWNAVPEIEVINAGIPNENRKPYFGQRWHYAMAAWTSGFVHILNRNDWDLVVFCDPDFLMLGMDCDRIVKEFWRRDELICAPSYGEFGLGGPLMIYKRWGMIKNVHSRRQATLLFDSTIPDLIEIEQELRQIFHGEWWNPWPDISLMFQNNYASDDHARRWPMVIRPSENLVQEYLQGKLNKPNPYIGIE